MINCSTILHDSEILPQSYRQFHSVGLQKRIPPPFPTPFRTKRNLKALANKRKHWRPTGVSKRERLLRSLNNEPDLANTHNEVEFITEA